MTGTGATFLNIHLPNPTTWFYLAVILGVALFFRFQKPWKLRNLDILMLFLFAPPLLLLREAQQQQEAQQAIWRSEGHRVVQVSRAAAYILALPIGANSHLAAELLATEASPDLTRKLLAQPSRDVFRAYLWLLIVSALWLLRGLVDLILAKRAPFASNLSLGGLAWLALVLFLVMSTWTFLPTHEIQPQAAAQSVVLQKSARFVGELADRLQLPVSTTTTLQPILALLCHGIILMALLWIGLRHFGDGATGMAAAVIYLLLPYTAYHLTNLEQVFPGMMIVLAIACYRLPLVAGTLLGIAAALTFFPIVLLPLWLSFYFRRGMLRFLAPVLFLMGFLAAALWLDPQIKQAFIDTLGKTEWQPWSYSQKPTAESLWTGLTYHYAYRLPLFIAYVVLLISSIFWPAPKNLGHLIAWSLVLILGVQFWYADAGGIYVLWYLPLLVLLALKPSPADRRPPEIEPDRDWLVRSARWLRRRLGEREKAETEPLPQVKTLVHRKAG